MPLQPKVRKNLIRFFSIAAVIVIVDQWTKGLVLASFQFGESRPILGDFFALTYVRNTGAAFSLFHQAPSWVREPFFLSLPVIALTVLVVILIRNPNMAKVKVIALSLVGGGAIGNFIDRIRHGSVVDFLHFHWRDVYHYPMFNVADCGIVVGVCLLLFLSYREPKKAR